MILGRLSRAISRQDWSTVLIELVVLVVGIFIGLQVDDWNNDRKDRSDEQRYLQRLHADVLLADELTRRVRDRLLGRLDALNTASDLLFDRTDRDVLSDGECIAVVASSIIGSNAPRLAAFDELVGTGRLGIIRNSDLLGALIGLEQFRAALASQVSNLGGDGSMVYLPAVYPDLFQASTYTEADTGEIRLSAACDTASMKADRAFLNQFTINADSYDVFIRDGLAPWNAQFTKVHGLLDALLGITHH